MNDLEVFGLEIKSTGLDWVSHRKLLITYSL